MMAALAVVATALTLAAPSQATSTRTAICNTFGRYCAQALRVSWCESRWNVYARNAGSDRTLGTEDDYLGLFQMGSYARSRFGHSWNAYGQSRSAYGYFRASGYSWAPWSCRP